MSSVTLISHPTTRSDAVERIDVRVRRDRGGGVAVTFHLAGDLPSLRIPEPRAPRVADRLWEHTCFEVFVAAEGGPAYLEFNLSPSREWMAHAFQRYRDGAPLADPALTPNITRHEGERSLDLSARLPIERVSARYSQAPLRLGLSAVIEDRSGSLSYWALRHPPGKPDFHHSEAFTVRLDAPDMDADENPR